MHASTFMLSHGRMLPLSSQEVPLKCMWQMAGSIRKVTCYTTRWRWPSS